MMAKGEVTGQEYTSSLLWRMEELERMQSGQDLIQESMSEHAIENDKTSKFLFNLKNQTDLIVGVYARRNGGGCGGGS